MTSANLRLLDKSAGVTGVGSGDLLGIKDVKSIIKSGTPSAKDGKMNEHENSHFNCGCNRNGFDLRHIAAVAVSATADTGHQQAAAAVAPAANIGNQQAATAVSATADTGDKCAAAAFAAAADARNKFGATVLSGQNKPFACLGCPMPAVLVLVH